MRRIVRVGILVVVLGVGFFLLRSNAPQDGPSEPAGFDRSVPEDGIERGQIDSHGPGTTKVTSPLRITARIESKTRTHAVVEIEVSSIEEMREVRVQAKRYDTGALTEASWSGLLWSGSLASNESHTLQAEIPIGPRPPASIVVRAGTETAAGARIAASDVVFFEGAQPTPEPTPRDGVVEFEGRTDSLP